MSEKPEALLDQQRYKDALELFLFKNDQLSSDKIFRKIINSVRVKWHELSEKNAEEIMTSLAGRYLRSLA